MVGAQKSCGQLLFLCPKFPNRKNWQTLVYRNLASTIRLVPHSEELLVPISSVLLQITLPSTEEDSSPEDDTRDQDSSVEALPQLFLQVELNYLVCDLNLPKNSKELLAPRLKEKKLLENGVRITFYRSRNEEFLSFFTKGEELVYCRDVSVLLNKLGIEEYKPEEWRLFIDSCAVENVYCCTTEICMALSHLPTQQLWRKNMKKLSWF